MVTPQEAAAVTETMPDGTVITKWLAFGEVIEIRVKNGNVTVNNAPVQFFTQKELFG